MSKIEFAQEYPWLNVTTTLEQYIDPEYYDKILKDYTFNGRHDLDYLKEWAENLPTHNKALELGPGSGRATSVMLHAIERIDSLTLVDLSKRMLEWCRKKFEGNGHMTYVNADAIDFLLNTQDDYDFVYCLWSFSHSVHQNLKKLGMAEGKKKVREGVSRLLTTNLNKGGSFFLLHFDSLSEEQRISIQQRKRDNPVFQNSDNQSPSKLILDGLLDELAEKNRIRFTCEHFIGETIEFKSLNEALEYYCNFHMESHFNTSEDAGSVLEGLLNDLKKYTDSKGVIRVKPGCFIYKVERID
ncbi:MAG: class I SAM-dependent methyltransferase [Patescibacteria group bacterium]